ncbi:hypothetical protein [Dethiobacter alkaliphilus]|uniref:hypothetical protein n=1 Tax=Dethiobacter alkaliphilus TaxID=427926 RepID=UPI00222781BF|nr:hypothetical protein [Dethiobacter alkaliphilus]MCW3490764.1 hypothetical protein [Dethiobacter alkaliphilus]
MYHIGFLVVNMLLAGWVASDAHKRNKSGAWGVFVFFTSFVGLLIYIVVQEGLQKEGLELPVAVKGILVFCILSLIANVVFFSMATTARKEGAILAREQIVRQGATLQQIAVSMEKLLEDPDDGEALSRLGAYSNQALLSRISYFTDDEFVNELFELTYYSKMIVNNYFYQEGIGNLSQKQVEELKAYQKNLRAMAQELNSMYWDLPPEAGNRAYKQAEAEILSKLQDINEENRGFSVIKESDFVITQGDIGGRLEKQLSGLSIII